MTNQTYFKIDFLQPGKNLVPPAGIFKALQQLKTFQMLFVRHLFRKVSTSATLLIVCLLLISIGTWFFHKKVYMPREETLKANAIEIARIQEQISALKIKIQQQQAAEKARSARLQQLRTLKKASIGWRDKLSGIQRTIVPNIWLNTLVVNDSGTPIRIVLKGATFSEATAKKSSNSDTPQDKPLQAISEFINTLMSDPTWHNSFNLKDWNINTADGLVNFELSLERK